MLNLMYKLRICRQFLLGTEQNLEVTACGICGAQNIRRVSRTKRPGRQHGQQQHITDYVCDECGARCRCDLSWEKGLQ